ncbi:hypothetical protein D621_05915 [beta proteobacterium AAP51]|nr:hypothetical protein D621_05915 [beta proteobacterium AAP51]
MVYPAQREGGRAAGFQASFVQQVQQSVDGWLGAALDRAADNLEAPSKRQRVHADYMQIGAMLLVLRQQRAELLHTVGEALRQRAGAHWHAAPAPEKAAPSPEAPSTRLHLSLISEAQIDDEIETARTVQIIEAEAEAELQELTALCSGLLGRPTIEREMLPLRPADCARALREGVGQLVQDAAPRAALLRALGQAVGVQMRQVYAAQVAALQQAGVKPAAFRIQNSPSGPEAPREALRKLVGLAQREGQPAPPLPMGAAGPAAAPAPAPAAGVTGHAAQAGHTGSTGPEGAVGELRFFDTPPAYGSGEAPLPQGAAEKLMQGLFNELRRQSNSMAAQGPFLRRVEEVAQRAALADPALWSDPEHPWWQLLDRLLATGVLHDDLKPHQQGLLRQTLEAVVQQVESAARVDGPACRQAADELQTRTSQLMESTAAPPAEEVDELRRLADREELEASFRLQIVHQLRSTPTSGELRRFLVGPWTLTLVALAQQHGADSPQVAHAALVVDDLIHATARPGQRVSRAQRHVLLRQVGEGLTGAAFPAPRVDAELAELAELLRNPPPHPGAAEGGQVGTSEGEEPPAVDAEAPALANLTEPAPLDLHGRLPTVPMALLDGSAAAPATQGGPAALNHGDWMATLKPGDACRLFLQGQWMTARLQWVGPGQRLFLFKSRHGGRSHSLTHRMLHKLREAGLATHIEPSLLRAQAMDSMLQSGFL